MSTISWRLITRTHPHADIFRAAVLAPDSNFKFNKVGIWWDSINCNSLFPEKNGYRELHCTDPDFPEEFKSEEIAYYTPPHPDKDKTFFFWKDYCAPKFYEEYVNDPEYMISHWRSYVFDGTTNYWDGDKPNYFNERWCLRPNSDDEDYLKPPIEDVPISCLAPNDETPTDGARRCLHYRKEKCIWAIKADCNCSSHGAPCLRDENTGPPCMCGFGTFDSDDGDGEKWEPPRVLSILTDVSRLLGSRMAAINAEIEREDNRVVLETNHPDEYMHTFCGC